MILVLGCVSAVASAGVGFVYRVTAEPIAAAAEAGKQAALGEVLPEFDATTDAGLTLDGIPVTVHTATAAGQTVGYAVETATQNGFSGEFRLMVGFTPDGRVTGVTVLQHAETPGLGDGMTREGNPLFASIEGRNPSEMNLAVRKDGGEVDALTAATITSRAYVDAVARAFNAMNQTSGGTQTTGATGTDAASGATTQTDAATGATATTAATPAEPETEPINDAENE
ncbi:MAG: RnfABCDGE type electron transport complex subunit G [Alistipes sp.]|jgi:electron transport complex protein RnfG|nr:RnfABCDGE type electron transport complex subunit G [Alistipes sp.]